MFISNYIISFRQQSVKLKQYYGNKFMCILKINRENRSGNQKWTIQRNWQHRIHKTQDENKQSSKH
jgi:hypothetical protein